MSEAAAAGTMSLGACVGAGVAEVDEAVLDAETAHLVSRWLHHCGLQEAAELVWRHTAARLPRSGGQQQQRPSYPPPLPHSTLPDDALRLMMRHTLAGHSQHSASASTPRLHLSSPRTPRRARRVLSSLPASLFHCGSQSVLPFFRCHPLHAVRTDATNGVGEEGVQAELSSGAPLLLSLRAMFYLSSSPSMCVRGGAVRSVVRSSSVLGSFRCLKRLYGHLCAVYSVVFDMTGEFFFTGSDDHLVKVWSSRSARLLWTLRGHSHTVTDIAVSPDNAILASASWDHSIRIWQLQNEACPLHVYFHQHSNKIWRIAFHPLYRPGHRLLFSACMDGTTQIFDLDNYSSRTVTLYASPSHLSLPNTIVAFTAEEASKHSYLHSLLPTFTNPDRPRPAQPRPQQQRLPHQALEMQSTEAGLSAAATGRSESAGGTGTASSPASPLIPEMLCVSHHPDGSEFALGSNDRCIRVYRMADKQLVALLKGHAGEIDQLQYDHDGKSNSTAHSTSHSSRSHKHGRAHVGERAYHRPLTVGAVAHVTAHPYCVVVR